MDCIIKYLKFTEPSFPKNFKPVSLAKELSSGTLSGLLALVPSLSLSPSSGHSTLFFISHLKDKTYLPSLQITQYRERYIMGQMTKMMFEMTELEQMDQKEEYDI